MMNSQDDAQDFDHSGDWQIIESLLTPTEAHMLKSCLAAAGVPADAGDTNVVQAQDLWFNAMGGVRLRVPQAYVAEAQEVIAAFRRGDFALGDDFDAGESPG